MFDWKRLLVFDKAELDGSAVSHQNKKTTNYRFGTMAGQVMPDCGGAWVPDTGGGEVEGVLPPQVLEQMTKFGNKGVVISGVVTWMVAQIGTHGTDVWRSLAERCFSDKEVTAAKDALKEAKGTVLENLVHDFKVKRQGGAKKTAELDDIRKAIIALESAGELPLVMATSDQMTRCPQSWGR